MYKIFHFQEPEYLWMLAIIPLIYLGMFFIKKRKKSKNILTKLADPHLLPHILSVNKTNRKMINIFYILIFILLIISLANPRWDYTEYETYQPSAAAMIVLDLSQSMAAQDVLPSRAKRARYILEDIVRQSEGIKIGILAYAANPHLVSPITDDLKTIQQFIPALDVDLITQQGDSLSSVLIMAKQLLNKEPGNYKSIILISDGEISSISDDLDNITLHAIKVGRFKSDIVEKITKKNKGIYIESSFPEDELRAIVDKIKNKNQSTEQSSNKFITWHDRYYLFLLPALVLSLYLCDRRALLCIIITFLATSTQQAEASIFENSNQKAVSEFNKNNYEQAAELFIDNYNRGVALYRAEKYTEAEQAFEGYPYNQGNAQMQQQKWQEAIRSYEAVLEAQPEHEYAKHNLSLAKQMLEEQHQEQDDKQQDNQSQEQEQEQEQDNSQEKDLKDEQKNTKKEEQEQKNAEQEQALSDGEENIDNYLEYDKLPIDPELMNRINSDIKSFLQKKFYIEDILEDKKS